jgi:NAD(P)-dependent dehydrogenase (short-subunit alcohol dehydrogenase family)
MKFENSTFIVTGGASGLGEATVRRFHGAGANVVIADLNSERGEKLAAELGSPARSPAPTSRRTPTARPAWPAR